MVFGKQIGRWLLGATLVLGLVASGVAAEAPTVDYERQIKPILREKCFACHGALKQESSLRVDTVASMREGGDLGAAIVPGDPEASLLFQRVRSDEAGDRMPLEGVYLSDEQLKMLETWIAEGAVGPENEQPDPDPRDHWSFRSPQRPQVPAAPEGESCENAIDNFLAAKRAEHGLKAVGPADRATLLRRVYLDLIGLPPTEAELKAFLADDSPLAYEKVVDRLLESPQYGERWGRHWMDVWRYSDWFGRRQVPDVWNSAPQIWHWRDWIVRSLNEDRGYDYMVQRMLAADEIAPDDFESAVATGYLIRNWYALNPNDWMRQNVEHTAKAFLGLTYNCAHCHDHKYDPIMHDDYFGLRAFFEPIGIRQDRRPGEPDPGIFQEYEYGVLRKVVRLGTVQIYDKNPDSPTWFYTGGDERQRVPERGSMPPRVPDVFADVGYRIEPVDLPPEAWYPGMREPIRNTIRNELRAAYDAARAALEQAKSEAEQLLPERQQQLAEAEAQLADAIAASQARGELIALQGSQSLLLDASTGRRTLNHRLESLGKLDDGTTLRFELMLMADAHFNVQLAKDTAKGHTAGLIAFENGRIFSYKPGSFDELTVANYDFASGQNRFTVELILFPSQDQGLLTIKMPDADGDLVQRVPVALNGWNPTTNPLQAITLDARPGSVVAFDDLAVIAPAAATAGGPEEIRVAIDFEAPLFTTGSEVVGQHGWMASQFSQAPATSKVSMVAITPEVRALADRVAEGRRAVEAIKLKQVAAEAAIAARSAEMESLEARIAADDARYRGGDEATIAERTKIAAQAEQTARRLAAEARVREAESALAQAEMKPADAMGRAEAIDAAVKELANANNALAALAGQTPSDTEYTPLTPQYPKQSTGRRRALAQFITSRQNPLTARVAINHIWLRHFRAPLVETVYDFGRNGKLPSHPELLDWLAVELMESDWRMKPIHRLIVTSHAYRMSSSSADAPENLQRDPENKYLWRMNSARMEAEVLRDSLLAVAGKLDLRMGGQELENSEALTTFRRTLYYSCNPETDGKSQFGALFDAPDPSECYRRTESILPQQALAMTNNTLVHDLSATIAEKLAEDLADEGPSEQFVQRAFERILSRSPKEQEQQYCLAFLEKQTELLKTRDAATAPHRARESLIRVLLNHNDFVTIR